MTKRHPKQTLASEAGRVVRRAAKFIEKYGWIQYSSGSREQGFCITGALYASVPQLYRENLVTPAFLEFNNWLSEVEGKPFSVPGWNDTTGRTKEEVLTYLHKFADEFDPQPAKD